VAVRPRVSVESLRPVIEASVNPSCGDCLTTSCHDQYYGCHNNANCEAFLSCMAGCTTSLTCVTNCETQYASVLALAQPLYDCTDASSATQCSSLGDAITSYAQSCCGTMRDCAPGELALIFGSYENCAMRTRVHETWVSCLVGELEDAKFYGDCTSDWLAVSCSDFFAPRSSACSKSGVMANGRACNASEQCESMFCKQEAWSCGVCAPLPTDGTQCTSTWDCGKDQWCSANGTCETPRGLGRSCSDNIAACRNDLMCYNGQCVAAPSQLGANCDVFAGLDCNWAQNLACSYRTNQCEPMTVAGTGETCGETTDHYAACGNMGVCTTGKCVAHPSDHGICDPTNDNCQWPAICSSGGTCMLPMDTDICR